MRVRPIALAVALLTGYAVTTTPTRAQTSAPQVLDTFTGPSGSLLSAHSPDVSRSGALWTRLAGVGTPTLQNGRVGTTGGSYEAWTIDTATSDVTLTVDVTSNDPTPYGGLVLRAVDANNYFLVRYDGPYIYRRQNGAFYWLGNGSQPFRPGETHRLEVRAIGGRIEVYSDGALQLSVTDAAFAQSTRHGLLWNTAEDAALFDNFQAVVPNRAPVISGPTSSVTVEETAVSVQITANDLDGSPLSYSASGLPPGLTVNQTSGRISGTVPRGSLGNYAVTVSVSDGTVTSTLPVPWRVAEKGTRLFDTFTGVNGAALSGHPPDITPGISGWSRIGGSGTATLLDGKVKTSGAGYEVWTIDGGSADVTIAADFTSSDATPYGGLVFRAVDAQNYFLIRYAGPYLYRRQNGTFYYLGEGRQEIRPGETHRLEVRLAGDRIDVYSDGQFQISLSDSAFRTSTRHGLLWNTYEDTPFFDNFQVRAGNRPPLLTAPSTQRTFMGASASLQLSASDPDGTALTFTASGLPPGLTIDTSRGVISGVLTAVAGSYPVTVTVRDGEASTTASFAWVVARPGAIVFDTFSDPVGTVLSAHPADIAPAAWTHLQGSGIATVRTGGKAGTTGSGYEVWTIDTGSGDADIAVDFTSADATPYGGLVLRATDQNNYLLLRYDGPYLYRRQNGQFYFLAQGRATIRSGETHTLKARLRGSTVEVFSDGVLQFTATSPFQEKSGRHGIVWHPQEDPALVDNFEVTAETASMNRVPVITGPADVMTVAGAGVTVQISASDPEGQPVTYGATGLPPGLTLDGVTGSISGVTPENKSGVYAVTFRVSDGTLTSERSVWWWVDAETVPTTRIFDSFSADDGTSLLRHSPDLGPAGLRWLRLQGSQVPVVRDGRTAVTGSSYEVWTTDVGVADVDLSIDMTSGDATPYGGLVLRATDAENYLMVRYDGPNVYRRQNGEFYWLGSAGLVFAPGETHRLRVRATGDQVQVYSDGVLRLSLTEPFQGTATRHGLMWHPGEDAALLDNYALTSPQAIPADWRPPCLATLSMSAASSSSGGGTGTVTVSASATGCAWTAVSQASWITITAGASGVGDGSIAYRIAPNTEPTARTGLIQVGDETLFVAQAGARQPDGCSYAIYPTDLTVGSGNGAATIGVTAPSGCSWTTESQAGFLTLDTSGGTDTGIVRIAIENNTGTDPRAGTVMIAGRAVTVTQAGNGASTSSCAYGVSPVDADVPSGGGTLTITVTTASGCTWSAQSQSAFVQVSGAASGNGSGTIRYTVGAHSGFDARVAVLLVAGSAVTVNQRGTATPGCIYTLSAASYAVSHAGGAGAVSLSTGSDCLWDAVSNSTWIRVTERTGSPGSGNVWFTVDGQSGAERNGTLIIGGQVLTVTQAASPTDPGVYELRWEIPYNGAQAGECLGNCGRGCDSFFDPGCGDNVSRGWTHEVLTTPEYQGDDWLPVCSGGSGWWEVYPRYTALARWTYHGYYSPQCYEHDVMCRSLTLPIPGIGQLECGLLAVLPLTEGSYCQDGEPRDWSYEFVDIAHTARPVAYIDGDVPCN